jgi:hypothetical protein
MAGHGAAAGLAKSPPGPKFKKEAAVTNLWRMCAIGAVLIALPGILAGCSEDVELQSAGQARLVQYSHSDECVAQGSPPLELAQGEANVEVKVDGLEVTVIHKNAFLNCCLDSIDVDFEQQYRLLKLVEREAVTMPCDCICPFEVVSTIMVSTPGKYTVEVWTEASLVWTGVVEVGGR